MSKYFSFSELIDSPTANAYCLDNMPKDIQEFANLDYLMYNLLDPLREAIGVPIYVNSGYRCPRLNEIVGGAVHSFHLYGCAADITTNDCTLNRKLVTILMRKEIEFDQCIVYPAYKFLHVSLSMAKVSRWQIIDNHLKAS